MENMFVEEEINNGPVIVQGNMPAANFDNFIQLGEGVQNIMLAYYDVDAENPEPQNIPPPPPPVDDAVPVNNEDVMFDDNNLVPPEVAHVQVGMALTHFFPVENEKNLTGQFSKQGMLLWEKYFAPHLSSDANQEGFSAQIPISWFNFITIMLMTPEKFDWTKNFLKSSLWEIISQTDNNEPNIAFLIPEKCSVQSKPRCTISEVQEEESDIFVVPPSAPTRKRRSNVHLVESEVRRSPRILELNDGFTNHGNCSDKNCLTCNCAPPGLKKKIVKNLAVSFCKVNEDALDKKLMKRASFRKRGKESLRVNLLPQRILEERRALLLPLLSMEGKGKMLVLLV
jgi:hypothetical protein